MGNAVSDVVYLYGFVPAHAPPPPPTLAGLEGRAVERVELDGLTAIVSELPAALYTADRINARLDDLQWVAERGLAHEHVVAWFVDHGEIIPASLFTLYSSRAALLDALRPRREAVQSQLERLGGRREWDLKVAYHREELVRHAASVSGEVRALDEAIAAAAPGKRFLLERKRDDLVKRELGAAARDVAGQLLEEAKAHVEDVVPLTLPRTAAELPVVLAAALLVPREREEALRVLVEQRATALERIGFSVELTGPWAAYRFLESLANA